MIRVTGSFAILAAIAVLGACAGQPPARTAAFSAAPAASSPAAAHEALVDATLIHTLYSSPHREDGVVLGGAHAGAHWTKWTKPDGTMELTAAHGLFADSGKFIVKGDEICASWEHIDQGRQTCMRLVKEGANEYVTVMPDGSQGSRFRVVSP